MGDLDRLLAEALTPMKKEAHEVAPTEVTDDFYRTVILRYQDCRSSVYHLSKDEYRSYDACRKRIVAVAEYLGKPTQSI